MERSLDLALVRTFVTVAELANFTSAARALGLSQSAVSLQIRRLEAAVGATLLHRSRREVGLTPPGEALLGYARQLLNLEKEALRSVQATPEVSDLRIGMPDLFASHYVADVVDRFKAHHPRVTPLINCNISSVLVEQFNRGQLDVVLSVAYEGNPGGRTIAEDELVWVGAPDLELEPDSPVPLAVFPDDCPYHRRALAALAEVDRSFDIVYVSQSTTAIDLAVTRGWALTLRNRTAVAEPLRIFDTADGLPPLGSVELEMRVTETRPSDELSHFADILETAVVDHIG